MLWGRILVGGLSLRALPDYEVTGPCGSAFELIRHRIMQRRSAGGTTTPTEYEETDGRTQSVSSQVMTSAIVITQEEACNVRADCGYTLPCR